MSQSLDAEAGLPAAAQRSPKSYGTAVALGAVFGLVGVELFYLGRWWEGLINVALTLAWVFCFAVGEIALGALILFADWAHSFTVTIMLMTGNFRDGDGRRICYPGQRIAPNRG